MNPLQLEIHTRLQALQPSLLEIVDDSALHQSHAGNSGGGHFSIQVKSSQFSGKSQIMRHRIIYALLQDLIPRQIHALSIQAFSDEDDRQKD